MSEYEITLPIGSCEKTEMTLEVNKVRWYGKEEKIDIRRWNPDHTKMSKGITLTNKEALELLAILTSNEEKLGGTS